MMMQAILVAFTFAAMGSPAVLPLEKTNLQLTASDTDGGKWTSNLGSKQVNVEHEHESKGNTNSTWSLAIARTTYSEDEDSFHNKEDHEDQRQYSSSRNFEKTYEVVDTPIYAHRDPYIPTEMKTPSDYLPMELTTPEELTPDIDAIQKDEYLTDSDGFEYFEGVGWFKIVDMYFSWDNAREACNNMDAHLAVPSTKSRVRIFLELFNRHPFILGKSRFGLVFVGVSDPEMNRVFKTVQGEIFDPGFPIWNENEPNNAEPVEYCVAFSFDGKIHDVPCSINLAFFCEKEPSSSIQ